MGLRILGLGSVLLLFQEVIVHLVLHFGALFGATQVVGLTCRADRVEPLGITVMLARNRFSMGRLLAGRGAVCHLLAGEDLWLNLIEAAAVGQARYVAQCTVAGAAGAAGVVVEFAVQAHGRLVGRDPGVISRPRGRHDAHASAVQALAQILRALLLMLACRCTAVLRHAHLALLLRVPGVTSRSRRARARGRRIAALLDAL